MNFSRITKATVIHFKGEFSHTGSNNDKTHMMSVVGKSTCSWSKTGLYISYHGRNAVRYIKERGYSLKDARISGYFDTKYMTVLRIA